MNHTASERSNARYLERLRIDAEYVSTVQRPNEDDNDNDNTLQRKTIYSQNYLVALDQR